jgi:hypothetical protein
MGTDQVDFQFKVDLKFSVKTNFQYGTTQEYERYIDYQDYTIPPTCQCSDGECVDEDLENYSWPEDEFECIAANGYWDYGDLERLDIRYASYDSLGGRILVAKPTDFDEYQGGGLDQVLEMKTITFTVGSESPIESGYFLDGSPWVRNNETGVFLLNIDPAPEEKLNAWYDSFMINETVINPDTGKVLSCQVGQTSIHPPKSKSVVNFESQTTISHWQNSTKYHKTCIPYKSWIIDGQPADHGLGYEYLNSSDYNVSPADGPAFDKLMNESEWISALRVDTDGDGTLNNGYYLGWDERGSMTVRQHKTPAKKPPASDQEALEQLSAIGLQALNSTEGRKDKEWLYNWDGNLGMQRNQHFPRWDRNFQDKRNSGENGTMEWWENGTAHFPNTDSGGNIDPEKPIPGLVEYNNGVMETPDGIRYWGSTAPFTTVQGSPNHSYYKAKDRSGFFKDRTGVVRYSGVWDRDPLQLQEHDFVSSCIGHYDESNILYAREEARRLHIRSFLQRPEYCGPDRIDSEACEEGDQRCNPSCGDVWWLAMSAGDAGGQGDYLPGTWNVHDMRDIPGARMNPPLGGLYGLTEQVSKVPGRPTPDEQWYPDASLISDEWDESSTVFLSGAGQIAFFQDGNQARPGSRTYCVGCLECNENQCADRKLDWVTKDGYDYKDFVQYYDPDGDLTDPNNIVPISWSGFDPQPFSKLTPLLNGWGINGADRRSIMDMYAALVCVPDDGINYSERFRPPFNWDPTTRYNAPYLEERDQLEDFNFGGLETEVPEDVTQAQLYYPTYGMDNEKLAPRDPPSIVNNQSLWSQIHVQMM